MARSVPSDIVAAARRIEQRGALRLPAWVHREAGERRAAVITDITTSGCRMAVDQPLPAGAHVTIVVRAMLIGGCVAWSRDGAIGVEFGARLLPRMLARVIADVAGDAATGA